jgi:MFS family permease
MGEVMGGEAASGRPAARARGKFTAYYALGLLTLIGAFNYIDKQVLGLVMPLVKDDLRLTDTQLGLLTGVAFVVFNALLSVPIARIADRWSRRKVIAIGLAFWSVMTAATGFVGNVWQLACTRFLTGAGEAAGTAPSSAMVSDLFGVASRPFAISVLTAGAPLGLMLFSPLAGWIADTHGWRAVFFAAGLPGVALALLLVTTVPEPPRPQPVAPRAAGEPISEVLAFVFRARSYVLVLLGLACIGGSVSAGVWNVTFLQRVHGLTLSEIGFVIGPVRGAMGIFGMIVGGLLADRLGRRDARWRLLTAGAACLLAGPSEILFLFSDNWALVLFGLMLTSLLTTSAAGPVYAACVSVAKPRMRATAMAVCLLLAGMAGQIFGPLAVGVLNDLLQPALGEISVRYSLLVSALGLTLGGACFAYAARFLAADLARAEAPD